MRISGRWLALASLGIVAVAFGGGAMSGKLEHGPATRVASAKVTVLTTTTSVPATTTTRVAAPTVAAGQLAQIEAAVVNDMGLDLSSQRLDPNPATRAALAQAPAAVARRHADISLAWAPDRVAATQAAYDALVVRDAVNPTTPSFSAASFVATTWGPVTVSGGTATVQCLGHYVLVEPAVAAGVVIEPDQEWTLTLRFVSGRWAMESRAVTSAT